MARYLIDTQVVVWLVEDDISLGKHTQSVLKNPENQVYVSYFSLVEIAIKAGIKKFTYDDSIYDDIEAMGIEIIQPDRAVLTHYGVLNPNNKDPYDNLLMSAARSQKLIFVTSDHKILETTAVGLKLIDAAT